MKQAGQFITLEGIEGVGKTTAVATVANAVRALGHSVVTTREPGGTPLGESIRGLLLDPDGDPIAPRTELLLMFAARAQHLHDIIEPALAAGSWVVCDRFTDATYAYQGGGRGLAESDIALAEQLVHPHLKPNLTIILDAAPELALARAKARAGTDRFEREELSFFARVRAAYLALASAEPERFRVIDASASLVTVSEDIAAAVSACHQ